MSPETFLSSSVWVAKVKTFFKVMDINQKGFLSLSNGCGQNPLIAHGTPQSPDPPKPPLKRGATGAPPFGKGGFGGDPLQLLLTTPLSNYEEIAERMIQNKGDRSNSEELREVFRSLFHNFVAGGKQVDRETEISCEEFIANAANGVSLMESSVEVAKRKNEVFFDFIDTDGSGEISREEYRKYLAIYFGEEVPERADRAFDSIDFDGNGSITREEFVEGHRHYWFEHTSDPSCSPLPYGPLVD